jgi:hypothetical protein
MRLEWRVLIFAFASTATRLDLIKDFTALNESGKLIACELSAAFTASMITPKNKTIMLEPRSSGCFGKAGTSFRDSRFLFAPVGSLNRERRPTNIKHQMRFNHLLEPPGVASGS